MADQPTNSGSPQGVFLNGKAQIIEMLELMTQSERQKILNNVRARNPALANELMEKSMSFKDLDKLKDRELKKIIENTNPQILGLALKNSPVSFQRRVLALSDRDYAVKTFEVMTKNYENERRDSTRAQERILNSFVGMVKSRLINL